MKFLDKPVSNLERRVSLVISSEGQRSEFEAKDPQRSRANVEDDLAKLKSVLVNYQLRGGLPGRFDIHVEIWEEISEKLGKTK